MAGLSWLRPLRRVRVYTDGAIRPARGASGLAAIVRDESGEIHHWWRKRARGMTNNEAEYAAVILALESLRRLRPAPRRVAVYSDSRILVDQARGQATARAPALRTAQAQVRALVAEFDEVTFHYIPRERNRLADALAQEAVNGWGSG